MAKGDHAFQFLLRVESSNAITAGIKPLRRLLEERRVQTRVADAEFIRGFPDCPERMAEAERYIRETMISFTLGAIKHEERTRILEILSFAVPPLPANLARPDPPPWSA